MVRVSEGIAVVIDSGGPRIGGASSAGNRWIARNPRNTAGSPVGNGDASALVVALAGGGLRGLADAEFAHASAEGAGVHSENMLGSMRALNAPAAIVQDAHD